MSATALPELSLIETRVLGVLVEKQLTVPDTYPLTLNALVAGCNQKTSRDPVLNTTEGEVQAALDALRAAAFQHISWRDGTNEGRAAGIPSPCEPEHYGLRLSDRRTADPPCHRGQQNNPSAASCSAKRLPFPQITALVEVRRAQRHIPNSTTTLRHQIRAQLLKRMPRCPCCGHQNAQLHL